MPRIESELRSRDLYQLLAEPTITEDPPPTSITLELPRLLTDSDTLVLTEEFDYFDSINSGVYKVAAPNLLVSPDYEAEADWDLDEDADHTVGITEDRSEFFLRGRTLFSAEIDLTASAGVGETTLQQAIDEVIGSVSGEVWVNLHEVSGAVIRLQLQALGAGESVVDSSTVDELSAATTGWERLAVEDYSPPSTSVQVQWSAPAGDAPLTHYDLRYRIQGGAWTQLDDLVGTSHSLAGLTAGEIYEFQVRAANSYDDSNWSTSTTFNT